MKQKYSSYLTDMSSPKFSRSIQNKIELSHSNLTPTRDYHFEIKELDKTQFTFSLDCNHLRTLKSSQNQLGKPKLLIPNHLFHC